MMGDGVTQAALPCSQNAHDETVLVRCAQWEGRPGHSIRWDREGR